MQPSSKTVALMRFLSWVATQAGVADHVYVVGGAVRNHLLGVPVKDLDLVIDSIALGEGRDSAWFAREICKRVPARHSLAFNQYGVAILSIAGSWTLDGFEMSGEVIEIANARKESYTGVGGKGKGYKPTDVQPATIEEDLYRREFTFNTLLWRLRDLREGPEGAEVLDLVGRGRADLEERMIRTPLDPDQTFSDDPTRMLRALKFQVKYGLKISPEVEDSIHRNASKLTQMPWEAVGVILVRDILSTSRAQEAIFQMKGLGLLSVLAKMIAAEKPFASYMDGQFLAHEDPKLLVLLHEMKLATRPLGFLTESQRERLSVVIIGTHPDFARRLLALLRKPPLNNEALIADFKLEGRARSAPTTLARGVILDVPEAVDRPEEVEEIVRRMLTALPAAS